MKKSILLLYLFIGQLSLAQSGIVQFDLKTAFSEKISVSVFKFYISNIKVNFHDGAIFKETDSYHLIDLEDSSSQIINMDDLPIKEVKSIQFTIGADSAINVSGALSGDLDPIKGMYWSWNSGYINFKLEGRSNGVDFEYHIGGYTSPFATARTIDLPVKNKTTNQFVISVSPELFLSNLNMQERNSVLIPGKKASELADMFQTIFSLDE